MTIRAVLTKYPLYEYDFYQSKVALDDMNCLNDWADKLIESQRKILKEAVDHRDKHKITAEEEFEKFYLTITDTVKIFQKEAELSLLLYALLLEKWQSWKSASEDMDDFEMITKPLENEKGFEDTTGHSSKEIAHYFGKLRQVKQMFDENNLPSEPVDFTELYHEPKSAQAYSETVRSPKHEEEMIELLMNGVSIGTIMMTISSSLNVPLYHNYYKMKVTSDDEKCLHIFADRLGKSQDKIHRIIVKHNNIYVPTTREEMNDYYLTIVDIVLISRREVELSLLVYGFLLEQWQGWASKVEEEPEKDFEIIAGHSHMEIAHYFGKLRQVKQMFDENNLPAEPIDFTELCSK